MRLFTPRIKRELEYEIFLLPAVILFLTFYILPMIFSMYYSFTDLSLLRKSVHLIGFNNYIRVFSDDVVMSSIKNTLIFAFASTAILNVIAIVLAVLLDKGLKLVNLLRMIIFAPAVISSLIIGYVWSYILASNNSGLANQALGYLGIQPLNWLGDVKTALLCIILVYAWQWTGWCMVIYLANLQTIPEEYYEASTIDGANDFQKFIHIILPLMVTSVTVNSVIFMIGGLKVYDVIIATTQGGPGFATESFTTILIKKVFGQSQYGYGSSIAVVLFVFIIILTIIQLRVLNQWERKVT